MQVAADEAVPDVTKVGAVLVGICAVDCPCSVVPLAGHGADVGLDLFGILVVSPVVHLKACNVGRELRLYDIGGYLLPVGDM